jgi:muconolactone delta-isomerase
MSAFFETVQLPVIDGIRNLSLVSRLERPSINDKQPHGCFETLRRRVTHLRQLSVCAVRKVNSLNQLWTTPALTNKLTSVRLEFRDRCFSGDTLNTPLEALAIMLARGSPNLKCLYLARRGVHGSFEHLDFIAQVLSKIALRELRMCSIKCVESRPVELRQHLQGNTLSSMEHLEVGQHQVNLQDLQLYAQSMPELKYLAIQVKVLNDSPIEGQAGVPASLHYCQVFIINTVFEGAPFEPAWISASKYVPPGNLSYCRLIDRFRFMLALWPNVQLQLGSKTEDEHAGWIRVLKNMQMEMRVKHEIVEIF